MYQKPRHPDWRGMGHHDGKSVAVTAFSAVSRRIRQTAKQIRSQKRYAGGLSQRARAACCPRTKVRAVCVQEWSQTELVRDDSRGRHDDSCAWCARHTHVALPCPVCPHSVWPAAFTLKAPALTFHTLTCCCVRVPCQGHSDARASLSTTYSSIW